MDMKQAARKLDFETAAILRDELVILKTELKNTSKKRPTKMAGKRGGG